MPPAMCHARVKPPRRLRALGRLAAACAATTEEDDFAVVIFLLELAGEEIGKVMQGDIERGSFINPNDATQVF